MDGDRMSSPRYSAPDEPTSATFITPQSIEAPNSAYESNISSFTAAGELTYSKNYGEDTKQFKFSSCAGPELDQADIYNSNAKDIVSGVMEGYHGTILAYGQTGSGKTYTMRGEDSSPSSKGIIPRALEEMFAIAESSPDEVSFAISYLQIYCEVIYDMLDSSNGHKVLSIREKDNNLFVENLSKIPVTSVESCMSHIRQGDQYRATAATNLNAHSSRSHAALIVTVTRRKASQKQANAKATVSNLVMVDLAGSERVKQSGARFQQFEELKAINLSLSALGNCVSALAAQKPHIPYRDSKLTRLLQHTLGGNSRTAMIVCCRPGNDEGGETYSTLMFARRASAVKVVANINEVIDYEKLYKEMQLNVDGNDDQIHQLEMEVANLKVQLEKAKDATTSAESQRDQIGTRLESLEGGFKASLAAAGGQTADGVDLIEAIESVSEKWQEEIDALQGQHSRELGEVKIKFEQKLKAYKAAANSANFDNEDVGYELEQAREGHLDTLNKCKTLGDKLKESERENSSRIAELLDEVNAKNLVVEDLEGRLQSQEKVYNTKITEMVERLEELEVNNNKKKDDMVSREAVLEMETLFAETVEKLMDRVNQLEGKQREKEEDKEFKQVGQRIERSRNENTDPQAMAILHQMESGLMGFGGSGRGLGGAPRGGNARGGNARPAPGGIRKVRPRQAF